jgi:hypothetical protein
MSNKNTTAVKPTESSSLQNLVSEKCELQKRIIELSREVQQIQPQRNEQ